MAYDIELVPIAVPPGTALPASGAEADALLSRRAAVPDPEGLRQHLLNLKGCRPGPDLAVDFHGAGLNYARLFVRENGILVESSCGARELSRIYRHVAAALPDLLILDLQSRQLHNAESYEEWWSRPL